MIIMIIMIFKREYMYGALRLYLEDNVRSL